MPEICDCKNQDNINDLNKGVGVLQGSFSMIIEQQKQNIKMYESVMQKMDKFIEVSSERIGRVENEQSKSKGYAIGISAGVGFIISVATSFFKIFYKT